LTGQTSLADIVALANGAAAAIGNDTGPMHMIAAAGCPSVVLFSAASDPTLSAPRGPAVSVLQREQLDDLPVDEVAAALRLR
jgi:ADP-heptose:LPS heptosyltransferase